MTDGQDRPVVVSALTLGLARILDVDDPRVEVRVEDGSLTVLVGATPVLGLESVRIDRGRPLPEDIQARVLYEAACLVREGGW